MKAQGVRVRRKVKNYWSMERNPFSAKNQTLRPYQSIYFAYEVDIISSIQLFQCFHILHIKNKQE